ncbi:translation initiation factor IF-3 [Paenibacillus sp. UMB4589-SE434]|uniref:translation initiation factor IF-3 n=1 Tax=Paenibacillus sp. UMB4589-SE434 TaxID=3046314 RepID=UPI00254A7B06|nr:translation initiation factor IF-3 [Paenibacillus sp. UMB4589-SE434]MDK8180472.1 translation initiation factor IF-3 [Paenibacillus sp. UMB4589-SE434]
MIKNEKIKAAEVHVTGINGEDLGIMSTKAALVLAKQHKVDLVCTSLMSSPPPCRLVRSGAVKEEAQQSRKREQNSKVKEIRLTARIEDHDYETKLNQAERLLKSGDSVQLVVKITGKEGEQAKALLQRMLVDLAHAGNKQSGIQLSGKQACVQVNPL